MKKALIITNLLLIVIIVFLFIKGKFLKKSGDFVIRNFDIKDTRLYESNTFYKAKSEQFLKFKGQANIVMLGNSLTELVHWSELLNRNDVVNRGIGGDITEGMLNRLESVVQVKPKICFFLGGMNDFINRVSYNKTVENIKTIVKTLQEHDIKVVIQSVLYAGELFKDYERVNILVPIINEELKKFAQENDAVFIELNDSLSINSILKKEYTYDGLHLNSEGYKKWGRKISDVLNQLSVSGL